MKALYKRFLIGIILLAIVIGLRMAGFGSSINVGFIQSHQEYIQHLIAARPFLAPMLYILLCAFFVALSIPVSILFTIASGFFFGPLYGASYSTLASTLGASISFLVFRYFLRGFVEEKYGDRLRSFNQELAQNGAMYILSLVLLPVTPFGIITILSGLSHIHLVTFMWTVAFGTFPGACLYAFAGKKLMHISKVSDLWSFSFVLALCGLVALAMLPMIVRYVRSKK